MKKNHLIIIIIFGCILFIHFILQPFLTRKAAVDVVETVLKHWQNRDLLRAIDQWEDPEKYPTVYLLDDYKFTKTEFFKKEGKRHAFIYVLIEFKEENKVLPTEKEWLFELKHSGLGWQVSDFMISDYQQGEKLHL